MRRKVIDLLKRHAIQVLRQAGHTLEEIAALTAVGKRSVQRVSAEPMVTQIVSAVAPGERPIGRPSKAEAGGSNGSRVRLWKCELQQFANRTGLAITVCHFPPGTSKWNKIEHRLFSHIAMNWRGKPLIDLVTIINLIGETTTDDGLRVRSEVDPGHYPKGVVIRAEQMEKMQLEPHAFHGDWNYTIRPRRNTQ